MCRFLIVNSKEPLNVQSYVQDFALMCKQSERWQGDGWGISWCERGVWHRYASSESIWKDCKQFTQITHSSYFMLHARGASFAKHKNNAVFNQPFTDEKNSFVFNGFLNGVSLPFQVEGNIGSQKVLNLIRRHQLSGFRQALEKTRGLLEKHTNIIEALNIGIGTEHEIHVLCKYTTKGAYHNLQYFSDTTRTLVCSEPIAADNFQPMGNGQLLSWNVL